MFTTIHLFDAQGHQCGTLCDRKDICLRYALHCKAAVRWTWCAAHTAIA